MALLAIAMLSASPLLAQSSEDAGSTFVYGKVFDAFDGLPLPGLVVRHVNQGRLLSSGTCNPGGLFYFDDKNGERLHAPPGEIVLGFEDGGHWLHGVERTLVMPDKREVSIDIGPTFFLDLPTEVPLDSEDLEAVVFGPDDDESRDPTRLNGTPVSIRTESYDTQIAPPWLRLPRPLGDGDHWLRLRWGDPSLEARALLPTKMGRYEPRLEFKLAPLGAIEVSAQADAIPRAQPFTLRSVGMTPEVERRLWIPRSETGEPSTLRIDWLRPGKYSWQLGLAGHFGSGTVSVAGREDTPIKVQGQRAENKAPAVVRVEIDLSEAPDVDLSQAVAMVTPNGFPEAKDRAGVRLVGSKEEGGFALEIEDLGPGRWWAGLWIPGSFHTLPQGVLIQDGAPLDTLRVEPFAPRMPLKIKLTPPEGLALGHRFRLTYFEGHRAFNFISEVGDLVEIEVPSTRPTPLFVYTESYGLTLVVFDPASGAAELTIPLEDQLHQSLIRVLDDSGRPLQGVSVDCGNRRLGKTDALGHLWLDTLTDIYEWIEVGASNPELEQLFPTRKKFELGVDVQPFPVGFPVTMRRRD